MICLFLPSSLYADVVVAVAVAALVVAAALALALVSILIVFGKQVQKHYVFCEQLPTVHHLVKRNVETKNQRKNTFISSWGTFWKSVHTG